jgi:hypothetical protein
VFATALVGVAAKELSQYRPLIGGVNLSVARSKPEPKLSIMLVKSITSVATLMLMEHVAENTTKDSCHSALCLLVTGHISTSLCFNVIFKPGGKLGAIVVGREVVDVVSEKSNDVIIA